METQTRYDLFEPGDMTALVCIDEPEIHNLVVEHLAEEGYKIHTGLFVEDISLKLKSHTYDVVIVYEQFNDSDIETNQVLGEAIRQPADQRRRQYLVLIGANMATNDELQAYAHSVDLVFSIIDLSNFRGVVRRGVIRHKEFYRTFSECAQLSGQI